MRASLGVEISSGAVRMAELAVERGRTRLVRYSEAPLPHGAVVDGMVADKSAVRAAILSCVAKGGFKASRSAGELRARVNVAGLRAIIREVDMPAVPDAELDTAVQLQSPDLLPFPADRTLLCARATGPSTRRTSDAGTSNDVRVLVAAAHRDLVESVVDAASSAGLTVVGVDLGSLALLRCLVDPAAAEDGPEAVVAVGAELTTVVVHERGEVLFVRTIAGGGNTVTRSISAALDLPFADAESVKRRLGASVGVAARVPPEAIAAARDGSASLLAEIRSSIEYFATLDGRSEVRRIVLTGGGAMLGGFLERLQHQTRATVSSGNCLERLDTGKVDVDLLRLASTGAVVLGLALPEPHGRKALDLVPPETVARQKMRQVERWIGVAAGVVVLGLVAGGALRYLQVRQAETGVGNLEGSIAVLNREIPRYDLVARQNTAISTDEALAQPLVSHEVNWPGVLSALVAYTPFQVGATGFSGSVVVPPASTTSAATGGAPAAPPSSLPSPSATIGTVNLSFQAPGFPSFQQWFDAMVGSKRFLIEQYSGVTNSAPAATSKGGGSNSSGIAFSAQLGITGAIHTGRLHEFEVSAK
jgi:type IV pilus assembly protein PilM